MSGSDFGSERTIGRSGITAGATLTAELRDAMRWQVVNHVLRAGLEGDEAREQGRDLMGMLGVLGEESLSPEERQKRGAA